MEQSLNIALIQARVGHARLQPKRNSFIYRVFYTRIPVTKEMDYKTPLLFSFNRWNLFSMHVKDYGSRDGKTSWYTFITLELTKAGIPFEKGFSIYLISHPRVFGFAFNPISYWVIVDATNSLRAVFCEVHNTFKETHNYLLAKNNNEPINPTDIFIAKKNFYVSPFNKLEGHYEFNFTFTEDLFKSIINYFDVSAKLTLTTYMQGKASRLTSRKILRSIMSNPAMTLFVVLRIHWQALKLFYKKLETTLNIKPKNFINNQTTISTETK